jgi:hypothetical protein
MFLGSRVRPVRRADNLTAICEPMSRQCGILNMSLPYRPPWPVTVDSFTVCKSTWKQICTVHNCTGMRECLKLHLWLRNSHGSINCSLRIISGSNEDILQCLFALTLSEFLLSAWKPKYYILLKLMLSSYYFVFLAFKIKVILSVPRSYHRTLHLFL